VNLVATASVLNTPCFVISQTTVSDGFNTFSTGEFLTCGHGQRQVCAALPAFEKTVT
jgi:hypothetical protein